MFGHPSVPVIFNLKDYSKPGPPRRTTQSRDLTGPGPHSYNTLSRLHAKDDAMNAKDLSASAATRRKLLGGMASAGALLGLGAAGARAGQRGGNTHRNRGATAGPGAPAQLQDAALFELGPHRRQCRFGSRRAVGRPPPSSTSRAPASSPTSGSPSPRDDQHAPQEPGPARLVGWRELRPRSKPPSAISSASASASTSPTSRRC